MKLRLLQALATTISGIAWFWGIQASDALADSIPPVPVEVFHGVWMAASLHLLGLVLAWCYCRVSLTSHPFGGRLIVGLIIGTLIGMVIGGLMEILSTPAPRAMLRFAGTSLSTALFFAACMANAQINEPDPGGRLIHK